MGGIIINEKCNLKCFHCSLSNREKIKDLSFNEIKKGLEILYQKK